MSRTRSKGKRWQNAVEKWLQANGFPGAYQYEGISDPRGDVNIPGLPVVIECKDQVKLDWSKWSGQSEASSVIKGTENKWVIIAHRAGFGSPGKAYFMVSEAFLLESLHLMEKEYGNS